MIQLPRTDAPVHVILLARNENVTQYILQFHKLLKYNQAQTQLVKPVPLKGALHPFNLGNYIWVKVDKRKDNLSPW